MEDDETIHDQIRTSAGHGPSVLIEEIDTIAEPRGDRDDVQDRDDHQNLNRDQYELLREIRSGSGPTVDCVSIQYRWAAGRALRDMRHLSTFADEAFRSHPEVLDVVTRAIETNPGDYTAWRGRVRCVELGVTTLDAELEYLDAHATRMLKCFQVRRDGDMLRI